MGAGVEQEVTGSPARRWRDLVAVGASAGGVETLSRLVAGLPADLPAAVLVVLHVSSVYSSALPRILNRAGSLPATHAVDGEPLRPGRVLVAPPDRHLLVIEGRVRLSSGPRENGHRPAIDPLLRSAARSHGPRAIGVVLSGGLDDGSAGLLAVQARGGVTVVQDPRDAITPAMPRSAIAAGRPDHVVTVDDMGALLHLLVTQDLPAHPDGRAVEETHLTTRWPDSVLAQDRGDGPAGAAGLSCPECDGALSEITDGELVRYRCRAGHVWSPGSLLAEQDHDLEGALWAALRSLEERAALARRMAGAARASGRALSASRFAAQATEDEDRAVLVRGLLVRVDARATAQALDS